MTSRRRAFLTSLAAAVSLAIGADVYLHGRNTIGKRAVDSGGTVSPLARALRPIYPYSVIPGGAFSQAELLRATQRDRYIQQHYRDFDVRHARLVTLGADRYQYVSFRIRDRMFWTKKRLRIPRSEVLLTDGWNYARTRCGNRLSSYPHPETTDSEPSAASLSLPPLTPKLLPDLEVVKTSDLDSPGELPTLPLETPALVSPLPSSGLETLLSGPAGSPFYAPPAYIPLFGGPGGDEPLIHSGEVPPLDTPVTAPAEVPEPTGLYVFGMSFLVSLWILTRMVRTATEFEKNSASD
ncbi:MAG: hypothetical protein JO138_27260 [Acidobacteriaceae bacterium]|nr:hypothetical protein [Acidobacteriaceae bacterium]